MLALFNIFEENITNNLKTSTASMLITAKTVWAQKHPQAPSITEDLPKRLEVAEMNKLVEAVQS